MFNSCAFPPPHGMSGSERLSSGAWVGTSLPSPVLLGTRQPRRDEAAPAETIDKKDRKSTPGRLIGSEELIRRYNI